MNQTLHFSQFSLGSVSQMQRYMQRHAKGARLYSGLTQRHRNICLAKVQVHT